MGCVLAIEILEQMVLDKAIDGDAVAMLRNNYDEFHRIRAASQELQLELAATD